MKRKGIFLLLMIGLLLFIGFVINVIRNRAPKQGELKVESQPSASVFLDNKHIGRTPIGKTPFKVDSGEYMLKITADTGIIPLAGWQEKIKVGPSILTYVSATLTESELTSSSYVLWLEKMSSKKSELLLTTTPDAATILFDEEMKGTTPLTIADIEPGDHTVRLISRGFVERMMTVRFSPGYRLIASVKLALSSGTAVNESSQSGTVQGAETIGGKGTPTPTPKTSASGSVTPTPGKNLSTIGEPAKPYVTIKENDLGYLRVRIEPSKSSSESGRVKPGEMFSILDTKNGWYQVRYDGTNTGWVSGSEQYVEKVE